MATDTAVSNDLALATIDWQAFPKKVLDSASSRQEAWRVADSDRTNTQVTPGTP